MPRLIDTHCHLAHGRLQGQVPEVLDRARQAGVVGVICASADLQSSHAAVNLANTNDNVWCTVGVHPHDAKDVRPHYLRELERLAGDDRAVAIGEIGLDFHYDFSPRDDQRRVFAEQLALAERLDARVVVHTRESLDDTLAVIRESGADQTRLIFHSFTGGPDQVRRVLDIGAAVSFSGIATFKKADDVRDAAAMVPDDLILVETDAPYLSPDPVRKMKTNEPANVAHVAACLAAVRGVPVEQFAELTTANAQRLFSLHV